MRTVANIRYSEKAGPRGTIDCYKPTSEIPNRPPMFFIHGGGWQSLSKESIRPIAEYIAEQSGATVWCPNYRLLPSSAWPAPLEDCKAAAHFALEASGADSLIVGGGSAGAHLAMLTGFELPKEKVAGILSFAGPSVLEQRGKPTRPLFKTRSIDQLFGDALALDGSRARLYPALHEGAGPPLALVHSINDLLVMPSHARLMQQRYRMIHAPYRYFPFEGLGINHGAWAVRKDQESAPALLRPFKEALQRALRFLYKSVPR